MKHNKISYSKKKKKRAAVKQYKNLVGEGKSFSGDREHS